MRNLTAETGLEEQKEEETKTGKLYYYQLFINDTKLNLLNPKTKMEKTKKEIKNKKAFLKNKKAVSLMLSYVILITIAITMAIAVFAWLKIMANVEPVASCEEETSIILDEYSCDSEMFILQIKNNGRFSVDGFILSVGDSVERTPTNHLIPFNTREVTGEGYLRFFSGNDASPLGPGQSREARFTNHEKKPDGTIEEVDFDYIRNLRIQPFIIDDKSEKKVLCDNVIRQTIENDNCRIREP